MAQPGQSLWHPGFVVGKVEFREGEGIMLEIRPGSVEVEITHSDATLSWIDGDFHGLAAIPYGDFRRYVADGSIVLGQPSTRQPASTTPMSIHT